MTQKISGNLHVSNDVLADLAGTAALGCYGVVGMAAPSLQDGIAKILPANRLRRGVIVSPARLAFTSICMWLSNTAPTSPSFRRTLSTTLPMCSMSLRRCRSMALKCTFRASKFANSELC